MNVLVVLVELGELAGNIRPGDNGVIEDQKIKDDNSYVSVVRRGTVVEFN